MKKIKKLGMVILFVSILLITACGGSSSEWGVEAPTGKYMMSENGEYPYIWVTKYEYTNELEEVTTGLAISVYVDDMRHGLSNDEAKQREDGSYYLEGSQWSYIVSFNGNGQARVEMEETGDNGIADAISKSMYKKAVGTYEYFEESTKTFNEEIEDAYKALVEQEKVASEEDIVESEENTEVQAVVYGTYSFDNGIDAVVQGDVGIYTDSGEDYIYLAALYYDSNHYTSEIEGVLEPVSTGVYHVKDAISGTTELEIIFSDGGMNVNIIYADTDEYNVLEGYYELISVLNFDEVG